MPVINGIYLKDFTALPGAVADANIIPIAITGDQVAYRTTVAGIITDARITSKLLTGLSVTGGAILATDSILTAFGKVQSQVNGKVPYTGATANVDLGTFDLTTDIVNLNQLKAVGSGGLNIYSNSGTHIALMGGGGGAGTTFYGGIIGTSASFSSSGSSDTVGITHSSGSGIALSITKGGNGEGIYVNKTSGSGNAVTIIGTLNATTLVKSGGTSSQFLKADGTVDSTAYGTGSVTSVAALTLGTSGTDLSSTVATGTTTPVITLNVPDASATARGVVTTGTQTFAGDKTFVNIVVGGLSAASVASTASAGLSGVFTNNATSFETIRATNNGSGSIASFRNSGGEVASITNSGALNLSAALSGTSATFSSTVAASAFVPTGATVASNGMYLSAANTLAFSTNSTNRVSISSAGVVTFTGELSGTSATFSTSGKFGASGAMTAGYVLEAIGNLRVSGIIAGAGDVKIYGNSASSTNYLEVAQSGETKITHLAGTGSRAVLADASGVLSAPVSDISVKQNIVPIGYGLNEIMKMNPVWFDFVDEYKNFGQGRQNGNIAQEMAEIIPESVFVTPSTGKMGINYDQLHAVYIKAIQELKAEIDILKNN
jgi:hypothetical protein